MLSTLLLLAGCAAPQATAGTFSVEIQVDGRRIEQTVPAGSSVQFALNAAGVEVNELDRVTPPSYTVLTSGSLIQIVRVNETFEIEEVEIPFERQTIRNEGLPQGETRLLQPGQNGLEEITYRLLFEGGEEISRQAIKRTVIREAVPEIVMVGAQAAHTPLVIEGKIAYLAAGNAWIMEGDTSQRRPLVVTGDLDGRIFSLSPDGEWLLYSTSSEEEEVINELWLVSTASEDTDPIPLDVQNVVHFAEWAPEQPSLSIAYSTVESRPSAPGWQANNDLILLSLSTSGRVLREEEILPSNPGGQYGWWGTDFEWAPDGIRMAYARADSIGVVDLRDPTFESRHNLVPFQTLSDWAWVPGITWGHDSRTLYVVDHGPPVGLESHNASPVFHLSALLSQGVHPLNLAVRTGMFAYPSASPPILRPNGEIAFRIAYYQALSPLESQSSSYRLMVMDRDGSNAQRLFPPEGEPGIGLNDLSAVQWSGDGSRIAFMYKGNLWIIDAQTGLGQQLTGDGQTSRVNWVP